MFLFPECNKFETLSDQVPVSVPSFKNFRNIFDYLHFAHKMQLTFSSICFVLNQSLYCSTFFCRSSHCIKIPIIIVLFLYFFIYRSFSIYTSSLSAILVKKYACIITASTGTVFILIIMSLSFIFSLNTIYPFCSKNDCNSIPSSPFSIIMKNSKLAQQKSPFLDVLFHITQNNNSVPFHLLFLFNLIY